MRLSGSRLAVYSFLVLTLFACASSALDTSDQRYLYDGGAVEVFEDHGDCYLTIDGRITKPLEPTMNQALSNLNRRECVEKIVIVSSHGGDLDVAMHIGRELRSAKVTTDIHQYCDSACAFIYVGGTRRLAHFKSNIAPNSKLGIHQSASELLLGKCIAMDGQDPATITKIRNYLFTMLTKSAANYFFEAMINQSCKSMDYVGSKIMLDTGIATDGVDFH